MKKPPALILLVAMLIALIAALPLGVLLLVMLFVPCCRRLAEFLLWIPVIGTMLMGLIFVFNKVFDFFYPSYDKEIAQMMSVVVNTPDEYIPCKNSEECVEGEDGGSVDAESLDSSHEPKTVNEQTDTVMSSAHAAS